MLSPRLNNAYVRHHWHWMWAVATFALILILLLPNLVLFIALLILVGQIVLSAMGVLGFWFGKKQISAIISTPMQTDVFLSIQVPACREPSSVLIATLRRLEQQLCAAPHEVIVILNNTPELDDWQPVQQWCASAGHPFRFLHCEGVVGAKAGALNIGLTECDPRTTHVVTVDADYQVVPTFLRDIGSMIAVNQNAFYQYPQAYRELNPASLGIAREMEDYFNRQALAANLGQAMLLTGTLSVIPKSALIAVGGWPMASCTEDAELGTRLIAAGYKGVYVDQVVGRGMMPLDVAGLHKQRHRWAAGNARVLALNLPLLLRVKSAIRSRTISRNFLIAAQLSAWLNFGIFAVVIQLANLIHLNLTSDKRGGLSDATQWLSAAVIMIMVISALPLLGRRQHPTDTVKVRLVAFLSRIAMLPVAAWATLAGFSPLPQRFQVTPKIVTMKINRSVSAPVVICAICAAVMMALAISVGDYAGLMTGYMMFLPLAATLATGEALESYAASALETERQA